MKWLKTLIKKNKENIGSNNRRIKKRGQNLTIIQKLVMKVEGINHHLWVGTLKVQESSPKKVEEDNGNNKNRKLHQENRNYRKE